MGKIKAVCVSEKKGTAKKNIGTSAVIENHGLKNDAHAGNWHRQMSLLPYEAVQAFRARGGAVEDGAFGENLLVEGFDFKSYPVGTVFKCNDVVLELTQIGKQCHAKCEIFHMVGDCIMPREGVFARVLHGGTVSVGDELYLGCTSDGRPKFRAGVITASDKGSHGEREDLSGKTICEMLSENGYEIARTVILPDDEDMLYEEMVRFCDEDRVDVLFTTGGTGFSPRDCTPEATMRAAEKNAPGIAEAIRAYSMTVTQRAMLGRGVSVIRNKTLIINLPGSVKAVKESLAFILPTLAHGIEIMRGDAGECGGTEQSVYHWGQNTFCPQHHKMKV